MYRFNHLSLLLCGLFLVFFYDYAEAQASKDVIIEGYAPFAKEKEIRLLTYDDLFNCNLVTVASAVINKEGYFKLTYNTRQIKLVQLAVYRSKAEFFVEPAHSYSFDIDMDPQLFPLFDPGRYGGFLQIKNKLTDTADLNYRLNAFSDYFNDAVGYYQYELLYNKNRLVYDTVERLMQSHFPITYEPANFYLSYLYYSFGLLYSLFYDKEADSIYDKFFNNDYILYDNPAYMNLFNSFYNRFLYTSPHISKDLLTECIIANADYPTLFNAVGKDPCLVNERIRELVIIQNLTSFYNDEDFDKGNIITLLEYIKEHTHFPAHKTIADDCLNTLLQSSVAHSFQQLVLTDENNKKIKFADLKGKMHYLYFFQSDCLDCIRELLILKELKKKYGQYVEFVGVNIDFDEKRFDTFLHDYKDYFGLSFWYFNNQYDWLNAMEIEALPDNVLLDADGNRIKAHCADPSRDLLYYLQSKFPDKEGNEANPMFINRN